MNRISITKCSLIAAVLCTLVGYLPAQAADKPTAPWANPHLANSIFAQSHMSAHSLPVDGPKGPSRRLQPEDYTWKPVGPMNGMVPLYSAPYPNGKSVVWVGGHDRVSKLDGDTLEVLATYAYGKKFYGPDEIKRHMDTMDKLDYFDMVKYRFKYLEDAFLNGTAFYRLLSAKNEYYIPRLHEDGSNSIQVFGEEDPSDPASPITLKREWVIPGNGKDTFVWGISMTSDGSVVIATGDGKITVLSQDFKQQYVIDLPRRLDDDGQEGNFFASFLRNSPATDDQGGIFVVTRDYMHRLQWTGSKISLDKADGAWSAPYPNNSGLGSGTTPALMGFGPNEDNLIVIADGAKGNRMVAFWRDEIPADWQGIPGLDRRIAGRTPILFGNGADEKPQIENSIVVHGYGAFLDNFDLSMKNMPDPGGDMPMRRQVAGMLLPNIEPYTPLGGTMIQWNPTTRKLQTAWTSRQNFAMSICTVSRVSEILYCYGARDGEWTLEATDWNTGESAFHYILGNSNRFNPWGALINIAPNGQIDCGCAGGFSLLRIHPE